MSWSEFTPWFEGIEHASKVFGIVAAIVAWIASFLFATGKRRSSKSDQKLIGMTPADLLALVSLVQATGAPRGKTRDASGPLEVGKFSQYLTYISEHRGMLARQKLSSDQFPDEIDVVAWKPNESISIRMPLSMTRRIAMGLFTLPIYLIFPFYFVPLFAGGIFGNFSEIVGAIIGLILWIVMNRRGAVMKFDLTKRRFSFSSPGGGTWFRRPPTSIDICESASDGSPVLSLKVEFQTLCSVPSSQDARARLMLFANSLRCEMGLPIEAAPGIVIGLQ